MPTIAGWVGTKMTRTKISAAAAAVSSIVLVAVAAGAAFRDARPNAVQPSVEEDSSDPLKRGDRLPWSAPKPLATASAAQSHAAFRVAA